MSLTSENVTPLCCKYIPVVAEELPPPPKSVKSLSFVRSHSRSPRLVAVAAVATPAAAVPAAAAPAAAAPAAAAVKSSPFLLKVVAVVYFLSPFTD